MEHKMIQVLDFINEAQVGKTTKSIIIAGKQGSGKTNLATTIAMATNVDYLITSPGDVVEYHPGKPGLIIIDEVSVIDYEMKSILHHPDLNIIMITNHLPLAYYEDDQIIVLRTS